MSWGATASWVLCLACFLCWPRSYTCVGGGPLGPRRAVRPSVPLSKKGGPTGSLFFFLTLYTAVMSFEILLPFGLWVFAVLLYTPLPAAHPDLCFFEF